MRNGRVVEGAHDVHECARLLQVAEQAPAEPAFMDALRQPSDVPVLDLGWHRTARFEQLCQDIQTGIRHFHGRQIRFVLDTTEGAGRGVGTGQRIEDGRFAALR
ncbi:hypothetical protein HRbin27_00886 [bacterium HR27]|nr:hypothetical protein HRbin27_00886 [bacterium HR27]